ncbi:adenosylcobalamin-dependent ribonucleoside-diphosphate reductase [Microbulbifer thermotolerans]|uniref:adenosylcobalamin-dependent ribonucleoside-diphosphate reductase n=1 Tax=Microbulbifer thermotolerans TaxID=252514 RepID=UPI002672562F|nr:adenosylcobalamin-dependent ribonucleoside-diphosphate reductase [Microbulbifer thermotolerans]WKT60675.1 adenosylcobalamin-dependent ribonucleoside-diphosphate reductase [Microbulbifer thermotolerans]
MAHFEAEISEFIWDTKYRHRDGDLLYDASIEDSWRRLANALASVEPAQSELWAQRFYQNLADFRFLPGGRIFAGAGTAHQVTLFNCFVMGIVEDSMEVIFERLKEAALTMQQGGGIGVDFSTLRPAGSIAHRTGNIASGPVSFMRIWDAMCATLLSTGSRRGAMMATLRCDHPDIERFIEAKRDPRELRHFNLSVLVSDDFMQAVEEDEEWPLVFPERQLEGRGAELIERRWSGEADPLPCRVLKRVRARDLWRDIMRAAYDCAEPGVLFIDQINRHNNLYYREHISATNPCGEIPLPPYGACNLGSVNLMRFVRDPFGKHARLDWEGIADCAALGVRMLDNVIDLSRYPLPAQEDQAKGSRRIGMGVTGLADALIALGLHYDSGSARDLAAGILQTLRDSAYKTSIALARERGSFPFYDREAYLNAADIRALPDALRREIAKHGIRNSHLIALAPTGTISLLAGGVSSGVEPVFEFRHRRRVLTADGRYRHFDIVDPAYRLWCERGGDPDALPAYFVSARQLSPWAHLAMEAALQPYVDNAISKTVNVPVGCPFEKFESLYREAHELGLKGCTSFRPNPISGSVLTGPGEPAPRYCCDIEREGE